MNTEILSRVVKCGSQYASGGNSQPFRFTFKSSSPDWEFNIDYIAKEGKHTLVYEPHLILISLGFAAEYFRHAFLFEGINTHIEFNLSDFDINQDRYGICRLRLSEKQTIDLNSYSAEVLNNRITNRNAYHPLSIDEEKLITSLLSDSNGQLYSNIDSETCKFIGKSDSLLWHSKTMALDMLHEASFKAPHYKGMPWRNLGTSFFETIPVWLIQQNPFFFNMFKVGGAEKIMMSKQQQLWSSSKSFIAFTLDDQNDYEQVAFESMKMANVILALTEKGFHTQPSTLSTEVLNYPICQQQPNLQNTNAQINMDRLAVEANSMREKLGLEGKYVNWMFRVGRPTKAFPKNARTERLPVSELLTINH